MIVTPTELEGVLIIEPKVFGDVRGFFQETYNFERYRQAGIGQRFMQDNRSRSDKGVLRGLHFQQPMAQGKLVSVTRGAIFDVAVDIRSTSRTFGRWTGIEITGDNHRQLWIPAGFAHGFLTLADETDVTYKCTDYYAPQHEHVLAWNDPDVGIVWPNLGGAPRLSEKDRSGLGLAKVKTFFAQLES